MNLKTDQSKTQISPDNMKHAFIRARVNYLVAL